MATEANMTLDGNDVAAADLSAKQFYCVKKGASGWVLCSAAGERVDGILQNNPTSGDVASVGRAGKLKAVAGAALAKGVMVTTDANGKLKAIVLGSTKTDDTAAAADALLGSYVLGTTEEASSADGDIISVWFQPMGAVPTTAS